MLLELWFLCLELFLIGRKICFRGILKFRSWFLKFGVFVLLLDSSIHILFQVSRDVDFHR